MAKNSILYRGTSYTIGVFAVDKSQQPVNWDDIDNFKLVIYSNKSKKSLVTFSKSDLLIDDPSTGKAYANITPVMSEAADLDLYIIEYKYKTGDNEYAGKGYWGLFVNMKLEKEHFEPVIS